MRVQRFIVCPTLVIIACVAPTQSPCRAGEFNREEIPLWSGVAPGSEGYELEETYEARGTDNGWVTQVSRPTLTVYFPEEEKRVGTGVVICPGGGYSGMAIDKEGHTFAKWFAARGVVAGVLKYRCGGVPFEHPVPLCDAQRALRMIRTNASKWKLDPAKIGMAGFSAGGHLASTAGTRFVDGNADAADPIERVSSRADFLVLVYPVISMREGIAHQGSRNNLLGDQPADKLVRELSTDLHVSADTGPTFLVHASDDGAVPVENSLLFYRALRKHKVPAAMHIYETGGHGFGMYRGDRPADRWPELLGDWLKQRGLTR